MKVTNKIVDFGLHSLEGPFVSIALVVPNALLIGLGLELVNVMAEPVNSPDIIPAPFNKETLVGIIPREKGSNSRIQGDRSGCSSGGGGGDGGGGGGNIVFVLSLFFLIMQREWNAEVVIAQRGLL